MDPVIPAELMSQNEYHFRMEQAKTIVERLAYYNNRFRHSVIWFPGDEFLGVWDGMTYPFLRTSNAALGYFLGRLPSELLIQILENLDIKSLLAFRQLSLKAREVVNSIGHGKYRRVIEHGYILLCALFRTRTRLASKISLVDIDTALCTVACAICGEFSGFISIPTWKRCCFSCLQRAPELRMQSLAEAKTDFDLTESQSRQLDIFHALPGQYTLERRGHWGNARIIVSTHQASMISGLPPRPLPSWKQFLKDNYMASCVLPFYDKCRVVPVVEGGLSCLGCYYAKSQNREVPGVDEMAEKLYTTAGFLRHFQWCKQAQRLWRMVEAGEQLPGAVKEEKKAGIEEPRGKRYQMESVAH